MTFARCSAANLFSSNGNSSLLDTGFLTSEFAEIVELSATHLTILVHLDALDVGRLDGEDTLHTYGARHLTNGETLLVSVTGNLDDYATIELDAFLVSLDNFVSDSHSVT